MATYKTITIKKKGGGSRKQRVMVLASGKYRFVKNKASKTHSSPKSTKKRRSNPNMARRKKKGSRRKNGFTVPMAVVAGVAAPFFDADPQNPGGQSIVNLLASGSIQDAGLATVCKFGGMTMESGNGGPWTFGGFDIQRLFRTYKPIIAGYAVHWVASKIGINRALGQAKVPFIRI